MDTDVVGMAEQRQWRRGLELVCLFVCLSVRLEVGGGG